MRERSVVAPISPSDESVLVQAHTVLSDIHRPLLCPFAGLITKVVDVEVVQAIGKVVVQQKTLTGAVFFKENCRDCQVRFPQDILKAFKPEQVYTAEFTWDVATRTRELGLEFSALIRLLSGRY